MQGIFQVIYVHICGCSSTSNRTHKHYRKYILTRSSTGLDNAHEQSNKFLLWPQPEIYTAKHEKKKEMKPLQGRGEGEDVPQAPDTEDSWQAMLKLQQGLLLHKMENVEAIELVKVLRGERCTQANATLSRSHSCMNAPLSAHTRSQNTTAEALGTTQHSRNRPCLSVSDGHHPHCRQCLRGR